MRRSVFSTMRVFYLFVSLLASALSLRGEEASGPMITVRKGTSVIVEAKEISGAAGTVALNVLRNDLQLSGALSPGDGSAATTVISGSATGSSFSVRANEKTGGVILEKSYSGDTRHTVHHFT